MHWWVAWLATAPAPDPVITPGTTTPVQDALHYAHLDFLISIGSAIGAIASIVGVYRTLIVATRGHKQQAEITRMAHEAYRRQQIVLDYLGITDTGAAPGAGEQTEPEKGPRMPKNKAKRWRPEPEPGDPRMLPDEVTPEPPEQDQVLNEEELPGDYAGDPEGGEG